MRSSGYDISGNWERWKAKAGEWRSNEQKAIAEEMDRLRQLLQVLHGQLRDTEEAQNQLDSRIVELRATGAALREILLNVTLSKQSSEAFKKATSESLPEFLSGKEAAALLRVSHRTLDNWRVRGDGPRFLKMGGKILYERSALIDWIESRSRKSTSDVGRRGR